LRDAVMITSAQKLEHYEIASYGTARTYAQVLGQPEVARLLQQTLGEEKPELCLRTFWTSAREFSPLNRQARQTKGDRI
jgi:hypothetical protein